MIKEAMCSNKLCEALVDIGMEIHARTGFFGKVYYECSLAQAMRWLREKKGIHIAIDWCADNTWEFDIVSDYPTGEEFDFPPCHTYEEAAEVGLNMAIEKVKNEKYYYETYRT